MKERNGPWLKDGGPSPAGDQGTMVETIIKRKKHYLGHITRDGLYERDCGG